MDRDGEGEGGFFGRGEGFLDNDIGSDLWVRVEVSGSEICSGGAPGGVLTETSPGIVVLQKDDEEGGNYENCLKDKKGIDK